MFKDNSSDVTMHESYLERFRDGGEEAEPSHRSVCQVLVVLPIFPLSPCCLFSMAEASNMSHVRTDRHSTCVCMHGLHVLLSGLGPPCRENACV